MLKRVKHFWVCCVIDCVCKRVSQERQPAWNPYFIVVPAITSGEGKLYSTRPLQLKTAFPLRGGLNVPWAVLQKYIHYLCKYVITSRYKAPITSHHITSVLCNFITRTLFPPTAADLPHSDEAQVLGLGAALGNTRVVEEEGQHHECRDLDRLKHRRAEPEALQQATIV